MVGTRISMCASLRGLGFAVSSTRPRAPAHLGENPILGGLQDEYKDARAERPKCTFAHLTGLSTRTLPGEALAEVLLPHLLVRALPTLPASVRMFIKSHKLRFLGLSPSETIKNTPSRPVDSGGSNTRRNSHTRLGTRHRKLDLIRSRDPATTTGRTHAPRSSRTHPRTRTRTRTHTLRCRRAPRCRCGCRPSVPPAAAPPWRAGCARTGGGGCR